MKSFLRWLFDYFGQTFLTWFLSGITAFVASRWAFLDGTPGYFIIVIVLLIIASALSISDNIKRLLKETNEKEITEKNLKTAFIKFQSYGDHRPPEMILSDNIFRWFCLHNLLQSTQEGPSQEGSSILFISFESDVLIKTLVINTPSTVLPPYEVKEYNQRFAIIVFTQLLPSCILDIKVGF